MLSRYSFLYIKCSRDEYFFSKYFTITRLCNLDSLNPLVTNGLSHHYHLDESILTFRDIRYNFSFLFHFSMKIKIANSIAPDCTPRFAASHLGLFCLPMSHKKNARLKWVKTPILYTCSKTGACRGIHFFLIFACTLFTDPR